MNKKVFIFAYWHDRQWKKFVGATIKIWDMAHNMSALGHDVVIFLPRYDFQKEDVPFKIIEMPVIDVPFLRYLTFNLALFLKLIPAAIKWRPDIFYIRRGVSPVPLICSKLFNAFLVFEVNDDPYRKTVKPGSKLVHKARFHLSKAIDEFYLKFCGLGVVITKRIKSKICDRNPFVDASKLIVVPSGANTSVYKPMNRDQCITDTGLDPSKKYVCFMGSLLKYQGVDVLIKAAPMILEKIPSAEFLIIGEGPMKDEWMREAEEAGMENVFHFIGQIDYYELPTYIGATEVCVAPFLKSVGYSSPVKIFDYMACGKGVVSSDITGTTDVFNGTGGVERVPAEEPDKLAEAIVTIMADNSLSKEMGKQGREFILEHYDRGKLARRISDEILSRLS